MESDSRPTRPNAEGARSDGERPEVGDGDLDAFLDAVLRAVAEADGGDCEVPDVVALVDAGGRVPIWPADEIAFKDARG